MVIRPGKLLYNIGVNIEQIIPVAIQILKFLSIVPNHILVVLDEAYDEYLSNDAKSIALSWLAEHKNLLISRSFSKAHGLAGLRIGYGVGDKKVINLMNRVRQPFNVNYIAQAAAIASLKDDEFINIYGVKESN